MRLNLNADLGESFGPWPMGDDTNLLVQVDSANVACGFHAGDPLVMCNTIKLAGERQVSIGAHPAFPDLQGFGRRQMTLPANELAACIHYQLAALDGLCRMQGLTMSHVKPHGALNNMACEDAALAMLVAEAVKHYSADLILLAPALSELASAALQLDLPLALEVFADRAYTDQGNLVSRAKPGSVLASADECIEHVLRMIDANGIVSVSGKTLSTPFHSICVHGDNAHAVDTAGKIRQALLQADHQLLPLPVLLNDNAWRSG